MSNMSRGRPIAGWLLTGLLTALFAASASGKLAGAEQVVKMIQPQGAVPRIGGLSKH
jgi:hypothetical protein